MDAMQTSSNFTGITELQGLQSISNNSGVTGSSGGFFSDFVQSLISGMNSSEDVSNLMAGLGVFSEEEPEDNQELMDLIASMMSMGVSYEDIMASGSFNPTNMINSAFGSNTNNLDASTYADLLTISNNTGTDLSTLLDMANGNDAGDGQLLMELALSSAGTNALNSNFGSTSNSEFDLTSYYNGYTNSNNTDLASQLYSANTNLSTAIAQAMATTQDSTIATVSEEPTEPEILEDISSFPQYIPTSTNMTSSVEEAQEVNVEQEIDIEDLNNQIETGIKNGDITDTKEMIIKLRPEGLGEVTVKLVQDIDSNIKIDIVTASEQTAKLLNDKLPQLRDSMRDLQADISEVFYNDNEGNPDQNAKDQAEQWAYNQEQRNQRQAISLDELDDLINDVVDEQISEISALGSSKIYI